MKLLNYLTSKNRAMTQIKENQRITPISCYGDCKTCNEISMHSYSEERMSSGFTKMEMKNYLGNRFCENAWRQFIAKSNRAIGSFWKFSKEDKRWYYF